jgi:hypothetical protein
MRDHVAYLCLQNNKGVIMISLICFESPLILKEEEAKELGLRYIEGERIGLKDNQLCAMNSYDHYKEDCIEVNGKFYKSQTEVDKDDPIASYYIYEKVNTTENYVKIPTDNHLVDLIPFATKCKHKFSIKESVNSADPNSNNIQYVLSDLEGKISKVNQVVDKVKDNTFNNKVNVHVGGGLITTYNEVLLREDLCTDVLQLDLNNGWRVIAVCIQPDQRRPDYILGRYNPDLDVTYRTAAARSSN